MDWNTRLREARDNSKKRNTDIASYCKVSNPTVNGWMTGNIKNIEAQNLLAVCRFLNVSPFSIMFGEEAPAGLIELPPDAMIGAKDVLKLLTIYAKADQEGRDAIMGAAIAVESLR